MEQTAKYFQKVDSVDNTLSKKLHIFKNLSKMNSNGPNGLQRKPMEVDSLEDNLLKDKKKEQKNMPEIFDLTVLFSESFSTSISLFRIAPFPMNQILN